MFNLNAKVQNAGIAAGVTAILVWLLHDFAKVEMPPEAAAGLTGLISALTGYRTDSGNAPTV